MLVNLCFTLNQLHLSGVAAVIRRLAFLLPNTTYDEYASPVAGYRGYFTSVLGTVAFMDTEGNITFTW